MGDWVHELLGIYERERITHAQVMRELEAELAHAREAAPESGTMYDRTRLITVAMAVQGLKTAPRMVHL